MDDDEIAEIIEKHWTPAELVEFLDVSIMDIVEKHRKTIQSNLGAILEECGYGVDEEEDDETEL